MEQWSRCRYQHRSSRNACKESIAAAGTWDKLKELRHGLEIDRTSCTSFKANQFRLLLTSAAFLLMQEIRRLAAGTELQNAQVCTLWNRLLKLGAVNKRKQGIGSKVCRAYSDHVGCSPSSGQKIGLIKVDFCQDKTDQEDIQTGGNSL
jgi:hypothetical protein